MLRPFNISSFNFLLLLTLYSAVPQTNQNSSDVGEDNITVNETSLVIQAEHNVTIYSHQSSDVGFRTKEEAENREATTAQTLATSTDSLDTKFPFTEDMGFDMGGNYDGMNLPPFDYDAVFS